ncbi:MAG TPA: DUF134 domain-containing protein [Bacteroidales bacterium]|mgnify:CR=1 FL=1|nr:DUF134 domain-containing protein [Bacteroidales bacterium]
MTPRIKKNRIIRGVPIAHSYKPVGIPVADTQKVELGADEFESFRLVDYEHQSHEQASVQMGVSRPTFTRMYNSVRKKIALALVEGKTLVFLSDVQLEQGRRRCGRCNGIYVSNNDNDENCPDCVEEEDFVDDSVRKCECMRCGYEMTAKRGITCRQLNCPQCGSRMRKKNNV